MAARGPDPVTAGLAALRGPLPVKSPNARTLAALRENPACNARRVLDAAGVIRHKEIRGEELEKAVDALLKELEAKKTAAK